MKAVVQRVINAEVKISNEIAGSIGRGLLVLVAITAEDNDKTIDWFANKLLNLRIFEDREGKLNLSVRDIGGDILVVSNFTIYADAQKGFRPSFSHSASSEIAEPIYNRLVEKLRSSEIHIETGHFGADMQIKLVNDGPVTLIIEK